jgi:hypothetical protein
MQIVRCRGARSRNPGSHVLRVARQPAQGPLVYKPSRKFGMRNARQRRGKAPSSSAPIVDWASGFSRRRSAAKTRGGRDLIREHGVTTCDVSIAVHVDVGRDSAQHATSTPVRVKVAARCGVLIRLVHQLLLVATSPADLSTEALQVSFASIVRSRFARVPDDDRGRSRGCR